MSKMNYSTLTLGLLISLIILLLIPSVISIPRNLNIIGRLTNPSGTYLQGNYNFSFRIYDSFTGGNKLFEHITNITTDSIGVYDIILENLTLNFSDQYYLGIAIYNDDEMIPRINLTSAPYSFRANVSDTLNELNEYTITSLNITGLGSNVTVDDDTFFIDVTHNRTGIGTTSPAVTLDIKGPAGASAVVNVLQIRSDTDYGQVGDGAGLIFGDISGGYGRINTILHTAGQIGLAFHTWSSSSLGERMRLTGDGQLGIGTTAPTHDLEVKGNVSLNSTLYAVSGNIGIGTATPTSALHVSGPVNLTNGSTALSIKNNGDIIIHLE